MNYKVGKPINENVNNTKVILNEAVASTDIINDLNTKITFNKPKTLSIGRKEKGGLFVYGYINNGKPTTQQLHFFPDGTVQFHNGKTWSKGGKWLFTGEYLKNGQLSGGWLVNDKGQKVSLKDGLLQAWKNFGSDIPALDPSLKPTNWDRSTVGDQGYWTILYDNFKKYNIGVKYENPKDPKLSTFMYFGQWVFYKDLSIIWKAPKNDKGNVTTYHMKFVGTGNKYAGQPIDKVKLILRGLPNSPFDLLPLLSDWSFANQKEVQSFFDSIIDGVAEAKKKQEAADKKLAASIFSELVASFDYNNNGIDNDYDWTDEDRAFKAVEKIQSKTTFDEINRLVAARGYYGSLEAWIKDEMSEVDPTEWYGIFNRLKNFGVKTPDVNIVYAGIGKALEYTPTGKVIKMIDRTSDKVFANKNAPRKYSQKQIIQLLKTQTSPPIEMIGEQLLNASKWYDDDEEVCQLAFSRINSKQRYDQLAKILRKNPYDFVKSFMNVGKQYDKTVPSVQTSYDLFMDVEKVENLNINDIEKVKKLCKKVFTVENPSGNPKPPTPKDPLFLKIIEKQTTDKYLSQNGTILVDENWDIAPSVYPEPKPYLPECIAFSKMVEEASKDKLKKSFDPNNMSKIDWNSSQYAGGIIGVEKSSGMVKWNEALKKVKNDILYACSKEKVTFQPTTQQDIYRGEVKSTITQNVGEPTEITMSSVCEDFGGLWVYDVGGKKPRCGCRNETSFWFESSLLINGGTINLKQSVIDSQEYFNWSNSENWKQITKYSTIVLGMLICIAVPGANAYIANAAVGLVNGALELSQENYAAAALDVFIGFLPFIPGWNPKALQGYLLADLRAAVRAGTMTPMQARVVGGLITWESQATKFITSETAKAGFSPLVQNAVKQVTDAGVKTVLKTTQAEKFTVSELQKNMVYKFAEPVAPRIDQKTILPK